MERMKGKYLAAASPNKQQHNTDEQHRGGEIKDLCIEMSQKKQKNIHNWRIKTPEAATRASFLQAHFIRTHTFGRHCK